MTRSIEVPDGATCARCEKPPTLIHRGLLYCGRNCQAHNDARSQAGQLSRLVDGGGGGSPLALAALDMLSDTLRRLEPVFPREACPKCWSHMQGGAEMPDPAHPDGAWIRAERCGSCNHTREAKR